MSYTTLLMSSTPSLGTCTPSFPTTRPTSTSFNLLPGEVEPCADPQHVSVGYLAESITSTGYEPEHLTEDKDLAEHEDLRVRPLFFHRQSIASTCDSAESIATLPPESDWDDEQIRALLASPLYLQEREANADRSQVYHSVREHLMSGSSHDPKSTGRPVALFSSRNRSNQETFPDRKDFSSGHQHVFGHNEPLFRVFHPEKFSEIAPRGSQRHPMLAEAKSEILKQECKVDTLNTCIRELQRQARSHRLEVDSANCGYEESRREQGRLHEEVALREKALRDTRVRNSHEMEEMKRAQEMRVDEFSIQKLRESHATIQELTSQMQELQERVNYVNDSREFQDIESICSGKLSYVPFLE